MTKLLATLVAGLFSAAVFAQAPAAPAAAPAKTEAKAEAKKEEKKEEKAAAKTEKDLAARQVDLSQAGRKFQEDAQTRQRELTNDVVGKVRDAVVAVAKDKNLDIVVADPVFANASFDITDDVVKKLGGSAK